VAARLRQDTELLKSTAPSSPLRINPLGTLCPWGRMNGYSASEVRQPLGSLFRERADNAE
jgi:hypothetical protein